MKVLVYILNDADLLEPLLDELRAAGVKGCTIFDASGMGRQLAAKTPDAFSLIFGSLVKTPTHSSAKVLLMILEEEKVLPVIEVIENTVGPLTQPASGVLFTFTPDTIKGLKL